MRVFDFTHAIETNTNGRGTIGKVNKIVDNVYIIKLLVIQPEMNDIRLKTSITC